MTHNWNGINGVDKDGSDLWFKGIRFTVDDVSEYIYNSIREIFDEHATVQEALAALIEFKELPKEKYNDYIQIANRCKTADDVIPYLEQDWIKTNKEHIKSSLDDLIVAMQSQEQFAQMIEKTHIYLDRVTENARCFLDDVNETIWHPEDAVKRAENIINNTAYIISAQNDAVCVCLDKDDLIKRLKGMSELYSPCNAVVINMQGHIICQGILGEDFIKLTINQIDKKEGNLKYYAQFDDSVNVIQDENMTPYGKSIIFSAHEDLAQLFVDKVNKKYNINTKTKDVDFFEFYETGKSEDKPLIIASLKDFVSYEDKSYKSFEIELTLAEKDILKEMLQDDISRKIDKEAAADLDHREALLDK